MPSSVLLMRFQQLSRQLDWDCCRLDSGVAAFFLLISIASFLSFTQVLFGGSLNKPSFIIFLSPHIVKLVGM